MEAARRLVLDGTGAAYFPATFIAADLKTGHLREVGVPALFRDLALVRPRRAQVSPALAAFIEEVRRETRTHLGR